MKIRTQLLLSAAVFSAVLLVIAASVALTTAELDRIEGQARLTDRVVAATNDLDYIANEYLLHGEPRQLDQWAARSAALSADLANLSTRSPEQQALVVALADDHQRLQAVFNGIAAESRASPLSADHDAFQVAWSRVGVQTQALVSDASRLAALLDDEADALRLRNTLLVSALLGAFVLLLLVGFAVVGGRTLRSVNALQAGANAVGGGDLGYRIEVSSRDEIGELARSFNRMARDLASITASRAELAEKEAELRESEAKYRNAVELSPDAILIHRDGRIVFANPAAAALVGAPGPDALLGRPILDLVHEEARERAAANIERDLRGERTPVTPVELRRDDGTTVPVQGRGAAIPFGGRPAVQVVLRDVTEERRAAEELRQSREWFRVMGEALPYGVWRCNAHGGAEYVSQSFLDLLEMTEDEMREFGWTHRLPPDEVAPMLERWMRCVETGEDWDDEHHVLGPDGVYHAVLTRGRPVRDRDGAIVAWVGINLDIDERKRAEEALREYAEGLRRSNEDLERFAYVASHDLQEPLRPMVSFSQLLERRYRGQLDADADEYIAFIVEGGQRMQALIQDLLAYSRVNTTRQQIARTDAEDVLAETRRALEPQLAEAGAVLTHDPLPAVQADPTQLGQVFANLISNAVKFRRPEVPLRIHVGARRTDGFWEFSVRDNGIGIAPEYFDRIFVIFQRLHTRETYPGTGIGLAIVKRIIDRHGGTVRVESTPGEGTTFLFTLPAA